jgi:hypothetical protein
MDNLGLFRITIEKPIVEDRLAQEINEELYF